MIARYSEKFLNILLFDETFVEKNNEMKTLELTERTENLSSYQYKR